MIDEARRSRRHLRLSKSLPNLVPSTGARARTVQPIDATMPICRVEHSVCSIVWQPASSPLPPQGFPSILLVLVRSPHSDRSTRQ